MSAHWTRFDQLLIEAEARERVADDEMWHRSAEGSTRGSAADRRAWASRQEASR